MHQLKTHQKIYLPIKRIIDLFGSIIGILFCFAIFWWWVIIINAFVTKGHPFFISERVGKNDRPFRMLKFRSMKYGANPNMSNQDAKVDGSITKFGLFLRASSIDETLQLFNILVGQMSLVGPRPLIEENDIDRITIELRKKNGASSIKPGLTGYAQIHERAELDNIKKAEYDHLYLQKFSFWMDAKIFFTTIFSLFSSLKGK